nr:ParB/RepB/Spo0J family partition protein [Kocuria sediminis]
MFFLPSGSPTGSADREATGHRPDGEDAASGTTDTADDVTPARGDRSRTRTPDPASPADDVSRETASRPRKAAADQKTPTPSLRDENDVATGGEPEGAARVSRETETSVEELTAVPGASFAEIAVAAIHPNRKQPRQVFDEEELAELAYSIGELGVLQPIVVRPSREDGDTSYELVMGERRWRATQRAGLSTIPAIVRETADDDLLRDALLENLHRSQLNPLEEAAAYQQLMQEFGTTQEELSRRIGRSRPQISNTIRLLRLPPLVQRRVAAGVLSSGHARALLSLADPAEMERLAQRIVAEGLSVRATEEAVALAEGTERKVPRAAAPAGRHKERLDYIAEAFADRLDTSVKIALGARKGKMTIEFASVEDLNRIIEVLDPGIERS